MQKYNEKLEEYILDHIDEEDNLLKELNRSTYLNILRPRMLSGHLQGKILEMLTKMIQPKKILEIGTYTGYSALCMVKGLAPKGVLHTIEINDELFKFTQNFFDRSAHKEKIKFHIGNALDVIPQLDKNFDLVFIDGDKRQYIDYYHAVIDIVRPGGYIFADNILWSGKILECSAKIDEYTEGIIKFNQIVRKDKRVEKVILPIRDGLTLIRRI